MNYDCDLSELFMQTLEKSTLSIFQMKKNSAACKSWRGKKMFGLDFFSFSVFEGEKIFNVMLEICINFSCQRIWDFY